jgi:hypothetical protein
MWERAEPRDFLSIDTASTNDLGTGLKTKVTTAITTLYGVCSCKTSVVGPS